MNPNPSAICEIVGSRALRTACPQSTRSSRMALGADRGDVLLPEDVQERGTHHEVVLTEVAQRERDHRQEQVIEDVDDVRGAVMSRSASNTHLMGTTPGTSRTDRSIIASQKSGIE